MRIPAVLCRRLLLVVIATICVTGARCRSSPPPNNHNDTSSRNVQVIPGAGVNWRFGDFPYDPLTFAGDLFDQINTQRRFDGIGMLRWHDGVALNAQKHSIEMVDRNYLALVSPDGIDLAERLVSSNPRIDFDESAFFVGIAQTPTGMFMSLMENRNSREAIRDHDFTDFGASFQRNPGPFKVTVIFLRNARPRQ
jgi:uncharacterized protein YkwD